MVTLQDLYTDADNKGISIDNFRLHNKKAFAIETEEGERAIVLDKTKIEDYCEEKAVLSEELGHLTCDALCFVKDYSNPLLAQNIRKAEYRALAWAYQKILPLQELNSVLSKEKDLFRTAEYFDVPVLFLQNAIKYYKNRGKYKDGIL